MAIGRNGQSHAAGETASGRITLQMEVDRFWRRCGETSWRHWE